MATTTKTQKILGIDSNAKTRKGIAFKYTTAIIYLSPAKISGKNLCPHASEGCELACLNTSGRGAMKKIQDARKKKTLFFLNQKDLFLAQLKNEINSFLKSSKKKEINPCIRLNGTSDLPWHNIGNVMQEFSHVQFYDYTPNVGRMIQFLKGELPSNYHLTFSRKEDNEAQCDLILSMGGNVATVFDKIPSSYKGYKVINGDESDLRFLDEKGVIVGLKAKGKGKKDETGFVIQMN
jgi:hypothetical protein